PYCRGRGVTASRRLSEIAKTIRSKNAGVDKITFDVIFPGRASYERVRQSGALPRAAVCDILRIDAGQITAQVEFNAPMAIKFTIYRRTPSGSPADADIFGSQQYGPLLDIEVPDGEALPRRGASRSAIDGEPTIRYWCRMTPLRADSGHSSS